MIDAEGVGRTWQSVRHGNRAHETKIVPGNVLEGFGQIGLRKPRSLKNRGRLCRGGRGKSNYAA
jgi:hypothetical protein